MLRIRASRPDDGDRTVAIWRAAVEATHDFLSPGDLAEIDEMVRNFLPAADLWVAVDAKDRPVGFMGLTDGHMDSLFVDPAFHGTGIGRALVNHALAGRRILMTDVNEQNAQAIGFYERLGFVRTGRSPTDDQGRPYPLIHLQLDMAAVENDG